MSNADRLIRAWSISAFGAVLVFTAFPGIDLATSRLFWDGALFPLSEDLRLQTLRESIWILSLVVALAALVGTVIAGFTGRPVARVAGHCWAMILGLYLLGPGLLVNAFLKSNWGRARPDQIEAFGGDRIFSAALWPTDQCHANCSFTSGEAASAAALAIAIVLLVGQLRPRAVGLAVRVALPLAVLGGGLRIAFGRHFLSDVVFSWLIVAGVALALDRVVLPRVAGSSLSRRNAA